MYELCYVPKINNKFHNTKTKHKKVTIFLLLIFSLSFILICHRNSFEAEVGRNSQRCRKSEVSEISRGQSEYKGIWAWYRGIKWSKVYIRDLDIWLFGLTILVRLRDQKKRSGHNLTKISKSISLLFQNSKSSLTGALHILLSFLKFLNTISF